MKHSKGFTLIELVVVIVILGILAATALPRFVDFTGQAEAAAADGLAGAIASSASIQYAAEQAGVSGATYDPALACAGNYLESFNLGDCSAPVWVSPTCTVTCGGSNSAVNLPL